MTIAATDYRAYAIDELHRILERVYTPLEDAELITAEGGRRLVFHGLAADDLVRLARYLNIIPGHPEDGLLPNDVDLGEFIAKVQNFSQEV